MTKKEFIKTHGLISAVNSVASQLESYYKDYHNVSIKYYAEDLRKAVATFNKK